MKCPKCGKDDTNVQDSRSVANSNHMGVASTRRRRRCNKCQHKWTTYEIDAEDFRHVLNVLRQINKRPTPITKPGYTRLDVPESKKDAVFQLQRKRVPNIEIARMLDIPIKDK